MTAFFVDKTNGDDANAGTEAAPWETVAKVNGYGSFTAGDTVTFVSGGDWSSETLTPPTNGVIFRKGGIAADPVFAGVQLTARDSCMFFDLDFDGGTNGLQVTTSSDHCWFLSCTFQNATNNGVNVSGTGVTSNGLALIRCTVKNNANDGIGLFEDGSIFYYDCDIHGHTTTSSSDGVTTHDNATSYGLLSRIYNNTDGAHFTNVDGHNVFDRCWVYDNTADGVKAQTSAAGDTTLNIWSSIVVSNDTPDSGSSAAVKGVSNISTSTVRVNLYNSHLHNGSTDASTTTWALYLQISSSGKLRLTMNGTTFGHTSDDTKYRYIRFSEATGTNIFIDGSDYNGFDHATQNMFNNPASLSDASYLAITDVNGATIDANSKISDDLLFPGNPATDPENAKPGTGSPAIEAGQYTPFATVGYLGNSKVIGAPDIGAFQSGAQVAPRSSIYGDEVVTDGYQAINFNAPIQTSYPEIDRMLREAISHGYGDTFPANPRAGQKYVRSDGKVYAYFGTSWSQIGDLSATGGGVAQTSGATFTGAVTGTAAQTANDFPIVSQITSRRKVINVRMGPVPTSPEGVFLFAVPEADRYAIESVSIVCDTTTTGSDASNRYDFAVIKADLTALQSTVKTTNGAEITAFVPYDLNVDQNNTTSDLGANAVYLMTVTKTGAPTDLAGAEIAVFVNLTETIL